MHRMKDIKKVQVSTCEVKYKNECHMVFGPVLAHIKIQGQIQQPLLLVWGLEHPGRPRGTLYPRKKLYLPKSYMDYNFCYKKILVRPTLLGGPLVKLGRISTIAPRRKDVIKICY